MISVSVERPDAASLAAHWDELAPHARNVFMHPTALKAAGDTMLAVIYVLLAWDMAAEPARLVGLWAMQLKHLMLWPYLESLPFNYAFLSTPVINPAYANETMPAFLAALARDKSLPKTLRVRDLDAEGPAFSALTKAAGARLILRSDQRPYVTRDGGLKRSGSTRKKLRQDWNRLSAAGSVEIVNFRDPDGAAWALESFLEMEQQSWKGAGGTALLSNKRDAAFARRLVADLAKIGQASVALLKLEGRPIAAQVLLYGARTAYTWKTSYDPAYGRFSPGALLVDKVSLELIDSGTVDAIDSCAVGDGFMASLWSGRKPMVDMAVSVGPGFTPAFAGIAGYFGAREMLKRVRNRSSRRLTAAPAAAVSGERTDGSSPRPPEASEPEPTADRAA